MENDKRSETIEKLKKAGKENSLKIVTRGQPPERYARVLELPPELSSSFESKEVLFKAILEPLVNQYEAMLRETYEGGD